MIEEQLVPIISVSVILSAITYLLTPNLGKKLKMMKIVGTDVHKVSRPKIPEMGGIIIAIAFIVLLASVYILTGAAYVLAVAVSTLLFGVYGLFDDLLKLGKYKKLAISLGVGLLLVITSNPLVVFIPLLLFLTISIGNIFNLFAGFNGLEIGCTSIITFFFSMLCLITGNLIPFYLSLGVSIILFGFLMHNKYPAKIFPGNIGTMTIGGFFAGICLYFNLYYLLVPLLFLHIADAAIKGVSAGYFSSNEHRPTKINGDNILVPGNDYLSLSRVVLKLRPMTERQLVGLFWAATSIVGICAVIVTGVLL